MSPDAWQNAIKTVSYTHLVEDTASDSDEPLEIVEEEIEKYEFPPLDLLDQGKGSGNQQTAASLKQTALKLQQTFESFGVGVQVTNVSCGPAVTRYELQPDQGVKVSRIVSLSDDIKLNLAVADIRIEAPIPGKAAVGIEVPNTHKEMVHLRDLLESDKCKQAKSKLAFAVGKDIGCLLYTSAKEYGIESYVPVIEALMQQESSGLGADVMQCSECYYNTEYDQTPGSIQDPEYSIKTGRCV